MFQDFFITRRKVPSVNNAKAVPSFTSILLYFNVLTLAAHGMVLTTCPVYIVSGFP